MAVMTDTDAKEIIQSMLDTAVNDAISIQRRVQEYKNDYAVDPHEDTAAQIERTANRYARKVKEAQALAIAVTKF
jgi:hypothetical protein